MLRAGGVKSDSVAAGPAPVSEESPSGAWGRRKNTDCRGVHILLMGGLGTFQLLWRATTSPRASAIRRTTPDLSASMPVG
jgi:hypothetical protein